MTEHNRFYHPYASFTKAQLPLLKVAALYFDTPILLDPVCASWDTVGTECHILEAVAQLQGAGILQAGIPAVDPLARCEGPITGAIRSELVHPSTIESDLYQENPMDIIVFGFD